MRVALGLLIVAASAAGAQPAKRYGVEADLKAYPQATPREALGSFVKAIDDKRIDYLLAHLADPQFVDGRVKDYGGRFEELLQEARAKLLDDPGAARLLRRFLKEGEWQADDNTATARLKDVADRAVFLRKVGDRWFLEQRWKPEPAKAKEP